MKHFNFINRGKVDDARRMLALIVAEDKNHALAWMALSEIAETRQDAILFTKQVLRIQPDNQKAQERLRKVLTEEEAERSKPQPAVTPDQSKSTEHRFAKVLEESRRGRFIVSTGDIPYIYEILQPIYFQVTNRGIFSSSYGRLEKKYDRIWRNKPKTGTSQQTSGDAINNVLLAFAGEWVVQATQFEKAFYMGVEELKAYASLLDASGIIFLRQDIDLDTNGFQYFYLQIYGTAVKILGPK
jgi:hypothetical protein